MLKKPSTPAGILLNLKMALDQDLLLRRDLYSDSNLEALSGGHEVGWIERGAARQAAVISGFGGIIPPAHVGNNTFEGISFSIGRRVVSGKTDASAGISFMGSNPAVAFVRIEAIFGKDWQSFPFFPTPPGRMFRPPSDPHGNDRIRYVLSDAHTTRSIVMEFHADGTLYNAEFSEESK